MLTWQSKTKMPFHYYKIFCKCSAFYRFFNITNPFCELYIRSTMFVFHPFPKVLVKQYLLVQCNSWYLFGFFIIIYFPSSLKYRLQSAAVVTLFPLSDYVFTSSSEQNSDNANEKSFSGCCSHFEDLHLQDSNSFHLMMKL